MCESHCGLVATIRGDEISLAPDPEHPVSRGYACRKGTTYADRISKHPQRVLTPKLRRDGHLVDVSWGEALASVGGTLAAIAREHGPESVGLYTGNAVSHSFGAILGATALQRAFQTTSHYSCLTLDNSEMFLVAERLFDNPFATFVADYGRSDLALLIGTDPLSSQASQAQSNPGAGREIRDLARAGRLAVVDPRRSVTARAAASHPRGLHLAPRVATDVFLLAWLLREALQAGRWDPVARDPSPAPLAEATAPFPLDRVSAVTGLPAADLLQLRDRLLSAQRPLVWSGLGVLLGPDGTLGWWLTVALQTVLGGLDREGGWLLQPGAVDLPRWGKRIGLKARSEAPRFGFQDVLGTRPAALLARDILDRRDRPGLRALVVFGGDPAASLPDRGEVARALAALDCLAVIDLLPSETSRLAHALLPAASWLERDESGLLSCNQRPLPHLRLDRAVTPPRGEARADFDIAIALCRAARRAPLGIPLLGSLLGPLGPSHLLRALALAEGLPWSQIASRTGYMAPPRRDLLRQGRSALARPLLAAPDWCEALAKRPDPRPSLRLLTSVRPLNAMNHWMRPSDPQTGAVHPEDAVSAGLTRVTGPAGELLVSLLPDPSLARGTVVLPFGGSLRPNTLVGTEQLEPFSGQPVSNGAEVQLFSPSSSETGCAR